MSAENRAFLEDDGLQPEWRGAARRALGESLQLSINQALMNRLDALERKVKELEHRQAV